MPKVYNFYKEQVPPDAVYIGRPSKWGNPFAIGKDGNRRDVIKKHKDYLFNNPDLLKELHELKGKSLECFCAPNACHGDILLELANKLCIDCKHFGSSDCSDWKYVKEVKECSDYVKREE